MSMARWPCFDDIGTGPPSICGTLRSAKEHNKYGLVNNEPNQEQKLRKQEADGILFTFCDSNYSNQQHLGRSHRGAPPQEDRRWNGGEDDWPLLSTGHAKNPRSRSTAARESGPRLLRGCC
jgi:hypothetical protein